jgi:hypothetical protein
VNKKWQGKPSQKRRNSRVRLGTAGKRDVAQPVNDGNRPDAPTRKIAPTTML